MAHYLVYRLDPAGSIVSGIEYECGNDESARGIASRLLKLEEQAEVWKEDFCVGVVSPAQSSEIQQ